MYTSGVGIVLCRLAAILLFVRSAASLSSSIQMYSNINEPNISIAATLLILAAVPAVLGIAIWWGAERISSFSSERAEQGRIENVGLADIVIVGTLLIGVYAVVFGLVGAAGIEAQYWAQNYNNHRSISAEWRVAAQVPHWVQIALGVLLILGRTRIADILLKARRVGTGTS